MQEAEKIRSLKAYAQAVLAAVEGEPPVTDPAIERLFQEIRSAAQETVRRAGSPVKIGVVGEFSAGKSLLLGSLIGYADALPISEVATTGNVNGAVDPAQTGAASYRDWAIPRRVSGPRYGAGVPARAP